jgi:hypothetical protein
VVFWVQVMVVFEAQQVMETFWAVPYAVSWIGMVLSWAVLAWAELFFFSLFLVLWVEFGSDLLANYFLSASNLSWEVSAPGP